MKPNQCTVGNDFTLSAPLLSVCAVRLIVAYYALTFFLLSIIFQQNVIEKVLMTELCHIYKVPISRGCWPRLVTRGWLLRGQVIVDRGQTWYGVVAAGC